MMYNDQRVVMKDFGLQSLGQFVWYCDKNADDVQRSASGYEGFWIAITGTICLVFWWILFTIWFCNKNVDDTRVDFRGGASAGAFDSDRTKRQKQPIREDSDDDDDEENSRMEL